MVSNRAFRVRACFGRRQDDEGVLWALGDIIAGIVLYIEAGRLHVHYNGFGNHVDLPSVDVSPGAHEVIVEFEALGARRGRGRLVVDGAERVAWTDLSPTLMFGPFEGFDVGMDRRAPVCWDVYERHGAFPYAGSIDGVWIEPGKRALD
jgi:arylsulfatase